MRFLSIDKIPFGSAVLGLTAVCLSGFVTFRPNRIAAGDAVPVWEIHSDLWIFILFLWAALILVSALRLPSWRPLSLSFLSSGLLLLLVAAAGKHAVLTAGEAGSVARISLGPAFWISIFTMVVIQTDLWQRSIRMKKLTILMVLVVSGGVLWMLISGMLDMLSIMREFASRRERFSAEMLTHLMLVGSSVGIALTVGMPLGFLAHRKKSFYSPVFFILNILQTMPSLALFGILIPLLAAITLNFPLLTDLGIRGIGATPAIIALTVYSLLPVARNTYTGFATVDPAVIDAGIGMGMKPVQLLWRVEVPIASPVILNGVRIALVQAIGLTAVAALIGAGGLGVFIFQGLGQAANDLILLGAIPTIFIAVLFDSLMNGMILAAKPKGLR